jgi:hypothetical protein
VTDRFVERAPAAKPGIIDGSRGETTPQMNKFIRILTNF